MPPLESPPKVHPTRRLVRLLGTELGLCRTKMSRHTRDARRDPECLLPDSTTRRSSRSLGAGRGAPRDSREDLGFYFFHLMWGGMCVWRRFGNVKIRGQGQCFATHLSFFVVHRTLLSPRSDNLSNQPLNQKQSAARLCFCAATFSPPPALLAVERAHARSRSSHREHRGRTVADPSSSSWRMQAKQ